MEVSLAQRKMMVTINISVTDLRKHISFQLKFRLKIKDSRYGCYYKTIIKKGLISLYTQPLNPPVRCPDSGASVARLTLEKRPGAQKQQQRRQQRG